MAKIVFERIMSLGEMKDILQTNLGSDFLVEIKNNYIQVVQDSSKGCLVFLREKDGRTSVGLSGSMPSFGLQLAIMLGMIVLIFVIGMSKGISEIGGGALGIAVWFLLIKLPSQKLVKRIGGILEKIGSLKT
jgi:hypothetical protein